MEITLLQIFGLIGAGMCLGIGVCTFMRSLLAMCPDDCEECDKLNKALTKQMNANIALGKQLAAEKEENKKLISENKVLVSGEALHEERKKHKATKSKKPTKKELNKAIQPKWTAAEKKKLKKYEVVKNKVWAKKGDIVDGLPNDGYVKFIATRDSGNKGFCNLNKSVFKEIK